MNILHTADWHIGAELNGVSLEPDFILFREWLIHTCIPETQADILLVSGDIFDKANPSATSRVLYFDSLRQLLNTRLQQVIITGGNHDSAMTLNAPADLLRLLKISVTGGVPENPDKMFHAIPEEKPEVLILSVPYLRDGDVRLAQAGESTATKEASVRLGIQQFFHQLGQKALPYKQQGIPVIAMGHLFATGVQTSDSERSIQVGNLGGVDASAFPEEYFDYVALGHIHRPQRVGNSDRIRYSGSPVALSYSERDQQKLVVLLQVKDGNITMEEVLIPEFRKLIRVQGSYAEAQQKLSALSHTNPLPTLVEVRVEEPHYDPALLRNLSTWMETTGQERKDIQITRHQFQVVAPSAVPAEKELTLKKLEELKPEEVFDALLSSKLVAEEARAELMSVFRELLQEVQEVES